MGPGTIAALEALLVDIVRLPDALFCSATDANGPGDRFANRHQSLARKFRHPVRAASASHRGRRLERSPPRSIVSNRLEVERNLSVGNDLPGQSLGCG